VLYGSVLVDRIPNPQVLSFEERERLALDGLGEREPAVKAATNKMLISWFKVASFEDEANAEAEETVKSLIRFAQLFSRSSSGKQAAEAALQALFNNRLNCLQSCLFNGKSRVPFSRND
jgi:hypothetical protein